MENSKFETLKPSQTPFFPLHPHGRRLLRSETCRTLGRILSHCHDEFQRSRALQTVPHEPKQDYGGNQRNELVCTKHTERNMLFQKESEENKEAHMSSLGGRNQSINGLVGLLISDQEDHFDVPEFHMEESGHREKLEVDEELCIREAIDSCFGVDMTTETTKPMENNEEKKSIVEKHLSEQIEQELWQKEMELVKLISSSGSMNSSLCVTADEDIEEGEILGGIGIYDESMDLLHEDAVSSKDKRAEEVQVAKAIMDGSSHDEQDRGLERDAESTFVLGNTGNNATNIRELELRDSIRKEVEDESVIFCEKIKEAKHVNWYESMLDIGKLRRQSGGVKESDSPAACLTSLVLHGKTSEESDTEIQNTSSAEKDEGVHYRKRKRVLTKERRAKKKQKERIKRAERNRKLGVKRLKLQPSLKPKKVAYCCHFLKGRCQEGEKCKFSHDTIPLTKSKPCCHFARHSCMKGDDCPFDHQLSKYPCNNFLSKGYCSRGTECMFSHEKPVKEGFPVASNASKPELSSSSLLGNIRSSQKQSNVHVIANNNANDKSCSTGIAPKSTEPNVAKPTPKSADETPKGISFSPGGILLLGSTSKQKQDGLPLEENGDVKVGHQMIHSIANVSKNSNEITKITDAVPPKGINFLAFGKCKSLLGNSSKVKQAGLFPKRNDGAKIDHRASQSASETVGNLNQLTNRTPPAVAPRGVKFLSSANRHGKSTPVTSPMSLLSNTSISVQKSLQSMLAFAAKFESGIRIDRSIGAPAVATDFEKGTGSSQNL